MNHEFLDKIILLRHELHANPELSMHEAKTKQTLMNFLRINTGLEIVDCGNWFYAVYKSTLPNAKNIAFRADFDAVAIEETCDLPYISKTKGIGHKCGHDGHSAALAGFALETDKNGSDNNIYFIFQHAEETGQGALECVNLIDEAHISSIYAIHNMSGYPEGSIIYRNGLTQCASKGLTIIFNGKPAHASQPEDGKNPAFAIADVISFVRELLHSDRFSEMVLCTIIHSEIGQKNFGISPGNGELSMTLRANLESELNELERLIREKSLQSAESEGLTADFEISDPFPETRNHTDAINTIHKAASSLGLQTIEMTQPWKASEDFGYYTKKCTGAIFYVGNGETYPPVHTGMYDFNDDILEIIVDMYCRIAMG